MRQRTDSRVLKGAASSSSSVFPTPQANGDRVLALIRGSAINQDGHTNGITAPNGLAQRAVLTAALRNAGVEPAQIGYVEAHGTGTPLGDPIEVEALAAALGSGPPVLLGAVKSNVGHLEGAAGVAGLIKTTLCLQRGVIPSVVHFTRLNPHITLDGTRLQVARAATPWSGPGRFAAVSSFGWSGTNANVVLEEAPVAAPLPVPAVQAAHLVVLSSPFEVRLPELAQQWAAWSRTEAAADAGLPAIATEAVRGRAPSRRACWHRRALDGRPPGAAGAAGGRGAIADDSR